MKPYVITSILSVALLLGAPGIVLSAEPEAETAENEPELSQTGQASCLLKITCDPATFPLDPETISALLRSSGVGLAAYHHVFGEKEGFFSDSDMIVFEPLGARRVVGGGMMGGGYGGGGYGGRGYGGVGDGMMGSVGGGRGGMRGGPVQPSSPTPGQGRPGGAAEQAPALTPNTVFGRLAVDTSGSQEVGAVEFMAAVCDRLRAALAQAHESDLGRIHGQREIAEQETARAEAILHRLQKDRRQLCSDAGQSDLSRDTILDRSQRFENEKLELEMKLAGQRARREALEKQIEQIGSRATTQDAGRAALRAAEAKVELLVDKLRTMRELHERGRPPVMDLKEAELAVVEAQVELAMRRQGIARAAGGGLLADFNNELATMSIGAAETEARLRFVEEQLEKCKDLLVRADDYEISVALEFPLAKETYETIRLHGEELRRRMRLAQPPVVTVLGGP